MDDNLIFIFFCIKLLSYVTRKHSCKQIRQYYEKKLAFIMIWDFFTQSIHFHLYFSALLLIHAGNAEQTHTKMSLNSLKTLFPHLLLSQIHVHAITEGNNERFWYKKKTTKACHGTPLKLFYTLLIFFIMMLFLYQHTPVQYIYTNAQITQRDHNVYISFALMLSWCILRWCRGTYNKVIIMQWLPWVCRKKRDDLMKETWKNIIIVCV